jgi:D-arabinose 1-dehydrogenase-like Zn-dependent alcohol dehydrogenase
MRRYHHVVTTAPLERRTGKRVGIVGIGGLGHRGIKLAHALGAHVVAFATLKESGKTLSRWVPTK